MATLTFDDFVKNLSELKKSYGQAQYQTGRDNIRNQGVQLRAQANSQGFDMNDLETKAQAMTGLGNFDQKQQGYVQGLHNDALKLKPNTDGSPLYSGNSLYQSGGTTTGGTTTGGGQTTGGTTTGGMDFQAEAQKYFQQLQSLMNNNTPYDPNTDPVYASAQATSQRGAKEASNRTLAELNRRGISGGSIASNQLASIEQDAVNEVQDLIPGLAANQQNQRQSQINSLAGMFSSLLGAGQNEKMFGIQEANLTGQYVPDEAQKLFEQILNVKKANKDPNVTKDAYNKHVSQANDIRNSLAAMGIDPSIVGGDVRYEDAVKNVAAFKGNPTMDAKKFEYDKNQDKLAFDYKAAQDLWKNNLAVSKEEWSRYAEQSRLNDADTTRNNTEAYRQHLKDNNISEKQANKATNGYMMEIQNSVSRAAALDYLFKNQEAIGQDGADVGKIITAINAKWPTPSKDDSSGGGGKVDLENYPGMK